MHHCNTTRLFAHLVLAMFLSGCASTKEPVDGELAAYIAELKTDLRNDFPFRAGMTIDEVVKAFNANDKKVGALMDEDFRRNRELGIFQPPLYSDRDLHLYVYDDLFRGIENAGDSPKVIVFWVNGRHQFCAELQFDQGKVTCIYIVPGNFSVVGEPFLYDGQGEFLGARARPPE